MTNHSFKNTLTIAFMAVVCLMLTTTPAQAHVEGGQAAGFWIGFLHPWSGWDHILAMVAVGLWGAQLGSPALWVLPITFPMVMSLGAFMGLIGIGLPGIEIGIAASGIVLGCMVFGGVRPPLWIAAVLVGVFAIFHGHAHGTELPPGQNGMLYSIGFVIATGLLHGVGITIGVIHRWHFGQLAIKGCGALIAMAGTFFLWQAI